jgi:hypothetical protein
LILVQVAAKICEYGDSVLRCAAPVSPIPTCKVRRLNSTSI